MYSPAIAISIKNYQINIVINKATSQQIHQNSTIQNHDI